jgi:hypothetical protein
MYSTTKRVGPSTQSAMGWVSCHAAGPSPSGFETRRPVCDPGAVGAERKDTSAVERIVAGRFPKEDERATTLSDVSAHVSAWARRTTDTGPTAARPLSVSEVPPDMLVSQTRLCCEPDVPQPVTPSHSPLGRHLLGLDSNGMPPLRSSTCSLPCVS